MTIFDILGLLVAQKGSDIHLGVGHPPILRIDGELRAIEGAPLLTPEAVEMLVLPLLSQEQQTLLKKNKEIDFGYQYKDEGRFRVNVYHSLNNLSAALRLIPPKIRTIADLELPEIFHQFTQYSQGLILITGPTGEGKSTTLAALIDQINRTKANHILTIEDPIEFVHKPIKSFISQRELNQDTKLWTTALKSALREDPDVVLVGEMRDYETIASTLTVAETGHLVMATLHTSTSAQTVDRIIDVFPGSQQSQIRQQLAATIKVVVSQRLLPKIGGGRVPAFEIMIVNDAIRNLIRDQKTFQIDNVMQTSAEEGMILIESALLNLVGQGVITRETAFAAAFRPKELSRMMGM